MLSENQSVVSCLNSEPFSASSFFPHQVIMKKSFKKWGSEITGGTSNREISMKVGIPMTTFHRKWSKDEFTAEDAVTIARAYGRDPVEAPIEQGTLTQSEVHNAGIHTIEEFTTLELGREVFRRIQEQSRFRITLRNPSAEQRKKSYKRGIPMTFLLR